MDRLEQAHAELQAAVEDVPDDVRTVSPDPEAGRWSVAEVVEHLALVERMVARVFRDAAEAGGDTSEETEASSFDPRVVTDRSRPVETIPPAEPSGDLDGERAMEKLEDERQRFLDLVSSHDAEEWLEVRAPHFQLGVLDGLDWIRFLAAHESRHADQIAEIGRRIAGEPADDDRAANGS